MHVLGSFSQKRKCTTRPRDLHIRKVSFSGSSVSSGSFSSSSSAATLTPRNFSPGRPVDPLNLHPTFQAPARLNERPLIQNTESPRWQEAVSFFDDDDTEDEDESDELPEDESDYDDFGLKGGLTCRQQPDIALPLHETPDLFLTQLSKRPSLPRSRWSESTIHTMESLTPSCTNDTVIVDAADVVPNFSYKRNTVPRRPTMKSGDSVENFVKRGGWKRRGIVFHNDEMSEEGLGDRGSAHTL